MTPAQWNEYQRQADVIDEAKKWKEKQTAVEWLIDQMFKQGYFDGNKPLSITNLDHLQHQAKEMEKQQKGFSEEEVYKLLCSMPNFFNMTIPEQIEARDQWYREQLKSRQ